MFDHAETITSITDFYTLLTSLVYPPPESLKTPPPSGWPNLNISKLKSLGKSETVINLLRHLPYFTEDYTLLHYDTIAIDYSNPDSSWGWDEVYPLPPSCVYLTRSISGLGFNHILDTSWGTITAWSIQSTRGMDQSVDFDALPVTERWRAYHAVPIKEYFEGWRKRHAKLVWMLIPSPRMRESSGRFHARAGYVSREEELLRLVEEDGEGLVPEWEPDGFDEGDKAHVRRLFETFVQHWWTGRFDREACRAEVVRLQDERDEEMRALREREREREMGGEEWEREEGVESEIQ